MILREFAHRQTVVARFAQLSVVFTCFVCWFYNYRDSLFSVLPWRISFFTHQTKYFQNLIGQRPSFSFISYPTLFKMILKSFLFFDGSVLLFRSQTKPSTFPLLSYLNIFWYNQIWQNNRFRYSIKCFDILSPVCNNRARCDILAIRTIPNTTWKVFFFFFL